MLIYTSLETERLSLRPLTADAATGPYLAWMNDADVMRYTESRFTRHTADDLCAYIDTMNASSDNLLLGLFYIETGEHIGNIKLGPIDLHHRRADVGIIIGRADYWGLGLATEAIGAVTGHALGSLRLHRLTAGCYETNIGSTRAFLKSGYVEDARLTSYRFSEGKWIDEVVLCRIGEGRHDDH